MALSVFCLSMLWFASGWQQGYSVFIAAVAGCFFASQDNPAPFIRSFLAATLVSISAAAIYLFALMPNVHDFGSLATLLAGPLLLLGTHAVVRFRLAARLRRRVHCRRGGLLLRQSGQPGAIHQVVSGRHTGLNQRRRHLPVRAECPTCDFGSLATLLAGPLLLLGTLAGRPQHAGTVILVAVQTISSITIQRAYQADFQLFADIALSTALGVVFALVWARLTRPFGTLWAARRLYATAGRIWRSSRTLSRGANTSPAHRRSSIVSLSCCLD